MQDNAARPAKAGLYSAAARVARRFVAPMAAVAIFFASGGLIGARSVDESAPPVTAAAVRGTAASSIACRETGSVVARPLLYSIDLVPDQPGMAGSGVAVLTPPPSPFGIPLTPQGNPMWDVNITVKNLPAPSAFGGTEYVSWATTADLGHAINLGTIGHDQTSKGVMALSKFIILITAERAPVGALWKGPVVLRGFSASTFLANYASHPLFLGGMPPC